MSFTPTDPTKAEVRITGTAPNYQLDFYIPAGPQGLPGDQAPSASNSAITGTQTLLLADFPSTKVWTLTGNATLVLPAPSGATSGTITLVLTQDAVGSRTITWPGGVKWPDGIAPQPPTAPNTKSVFHLLWTGVEWLGMLGGRSFA